MEEEQILEPVSNSKLEKDDHGNRNLCEECKDKESKYKCPGCSVRSCSLLCVKSHKLRTGCTGKRNRAESIPISHFTDNHLLSDYFLLEDVKRVAESAQRMRNKLSIYSCFRLPFHLKKLRSAAYAGRRTRLLFLPSGMSKREQNQTRYDQRKKCIYWTIEWRFHLTDVVLVDHGVDETLSLSTAIGSHLKPGPWNHQLKKFCDEELNSLKFFIRKYQKGSKSPFYELDIKVPLRQQLANMCILEYPIIHVFLPSHPIDFEVLKQAPPIIHKPQARNFGNDNQLSPSGVPFKEEEIEEDGGDDSSMAPREVDMLKRGNLASQQQLTCSTSANTLDRALSSPGVVGGSGLPLSCTKAIEKVLFDDIEYEFDQELVDAYSDIMAEINPDGFLDFDCFLDEKDDKKQGKGKDFLGNGREVFITGDELEEGEIAE